MTTQLTESQAFKAAHEMEATGGGFASAIATAFFRADSANRAILLNAFAPLFFQHALRVEATSPPATPSPASPPGNASRAISWQTGRSYGVFGQRMAAYMTPMRRILFVDLDRGIEGLSAYTTEAPLSIQLVMSCYDSGQYTHPPMTDVDDDRSVYEEELRQLREEARKVPSAFGTR